MKTLPCLLFMVVTLYLQGQKHDYNWVMCSPNVILRFNESGFTVDSSTPLRKVDFFISSSTFSDSSGTLLLVTNGNKIYNAQGELIENGDRLYKSKADSTYLGIKYGDDNGHGLIANPVFLPLAQGSDTVAILHKSLGSTYHSIYYNLVVKNNTSNGGWYLDVQNKLLLDSASGSGIGFCKHANGKDWWVIGRKTNSNEYVKWSCKADGSITLSNIQVIGPEYVNPDFYVQSIFNHTGNRYLTGGKDHTSLFDFDRCTGTLIYRDSIVTPYDSLFNGVTGMQFSKSGEMLYITRYNTLTQYKISEFSTDDSRILLCDLRVNNMYRKFAHMQLAPDNRIFISGYGSPIPFSIINYPDSGGLACGLDTFVLPFNNLLNTTGMPTYPHYRTPAAEVWQAGAGASRAICDTAIAQGVQLGKPHIPGITYHWSSPHNTGFSSTQPQPVVYPTQTTTYILHLRDTVNTYYSCTERWDTVTVTIQKCIDTTAPPKPIQGISIFPNPFKSELTLQTDTDGVFELYNTLGQLILKTNLQGQQTQTISTAHMAAGVYHYRFTKTNSETKQGKVVKE